MALQSDELILDSVTADPTPAVAGLIWFRSDLNQLRWYPPSLVAEPIDKFGSTAALVPFVPNGDIEATDVQAAIEEVRDDLKLGGARRSYGDGRLTLQGSNFPMTAFVISADTSASGGVHHIIDQFSDYARCFWRIRVMTGAGIVEYEDLQFATAGDLAAWANANVANNGSSFQDYSTWEVYDIVGTNNSVMPIVKVFAQNRTYKHLLDDDNPPIRYLTPKTHAIPPGQQIDKGPFLDALWQAAWGTTLSATIGPTSGWGTAEHGLFWNHRNGRSLYQIPNPSSLEMTGTNGRQGLTTGGSVVAASGQWFGDPNPRPEEWAYASATLALASFNAFGKQDSWIEMKSRLAGGRNSIVVGIPIWNPANGQKAMYVKPVGVDDVWTSAFDDSKYRIEILGTQNSRGGLRLTVPGALEFNHPDQRCAGPWNPEDWKNLTGVVYQGASRGNHSGPGMVRFQLRNLDTNLVSPLSISGLNARLRRRGAPFSWELKHVPTV